MEPWKRTMWILWGGVVLCSSSYTMSVPFLPLFLLELGVDDTTVNLWAGAVYSSAFLIGAIMAPFWGGLADRYGKRKMVIRAGISLAVIYALFAFVQTPWQLIGARLLHGFVGGFVPASMAIVASTAPEKQMGWSLGMMQAGTMSGGILGPLFGGLLSEWFGFRMSFIVAAVLIFVAAVAVIIWVHDGKGGSNPSAVRSSILQTWKEAAANRTLVLMLLLLFVFQLSVNMIQPLLTLHVAGLQGDLAGAVLTSGIIFSIIGIAGIVASPFWGRIGQKLSCSFILSVCLLASGGVVSMQFFVQQLWLFTVVQFVYGFFMAGITPAINAMVIRNTDAGFRGRSFGLTASANQFGAMAGPLLGGALGLGLNIHWVFVVTGVILIATGAVVYSGFRQGGAGQSTHEAKSI
ncbi:MFS transporter [Paenibacillus xerothermodurans]|uniref:MFS transporter n=1 Tax=Paenibacillus xerothermodurans TaxID=1977292 RepID=A0A2W1NBG3_PAEXE|nr:MFS transporter [Paenibacillus xerothermodurans]PZE21244.1 MFS transporter [Paenibacillus xerothermodurans]